MSSVMLHNMNFDEIEISHIENLIECSAPESIFLEFKKCSYSKAEGKKSDYEKKKEFLKDISAFANSLGGNLILGIEEHKGSASKICAIEGNASKEIETLTEIAQYGIDPPIVGLRMKGIECEGGTIIIIQIPRSYNPPHRVCLQRSNRFYVRKSNSVLEPSVEELRQLFGQQRSLEEQAKAFINQRILHIQGDDVEFQFKQKKRLILHLIPLLDLGAKKKHEFSRLKHNTDDIILFGHTGHGYYINLDGYLIKSTNECINSYVQIFKNGSIESVTENFLNNENNIASKKLFKILNDTTISQLNYLNSIDALPPILLQISLLGMSGVSMPVENYFLNKHYSKEELILPSLIIDEFNSDKKYQQVLLEQMNLLWNAFGIEKCNYFFDDVGNVLVQGKSYDDKAELELQSSNQVNKM